MSAGLHLSKSLLLRLMELGKVSSDATEKVSPCEYPENARRSHSQPTVVLGDLGTGLQKIEEGSLDLTSCSAEQVSLHKCLQYINPSLLYQHMTIRLNKSSILDCEPLLLQFYRCIHLEAKDFLAKVRSTDNIGV